jgi:hypothetical protein
MGSLVSADGNRTGTPVSAPFAGNEDLHQEVSRLRELVDVAEAAISTLRNRCDDAEESKAHLARMAVASARLHESDDPAESLRNLQDVLVNLIGTEQIAVWSLSADGRTFDLRASLGIDAEPWRQVPVGNGMLGKTLASGEIVLQAQTDGGQPTACIPLLVGRRVVGVVAVFRLLPHRSGLGPQDDDVFRLVSQQAGYALCCSGEPWCGTRKVGDG